MSQDFVSVAVFLLPWEIVVPLLSLTVKHCSLASPLESHQPTRKSGSPAWQAQVLGSCAQTLQWKIAVKASRGAVLPSLM